jgi:minor extracellular serine protease Vpr
MLQQLRAYLLLILVGLSLAPAAGQTVPNRYTLVLEDQAVGERFSSSAAFKAKAATDYRTQIEARQKALRLELTRRNIQVTGSVTTVLNAVFVAAPASRVAEMQSIAGVKAVLPARRYRKQLNRATQLLNAPGAWNALGGSQNAGKGIKIAILDSGIDQTHPSFQDSSLPMPAGYPICSSSDCAYTNNKVIVARSYVKQLAAGTPPAVAADSRPDDYSPRDRDGHGTAVASCAAGNATSGLVAFSGVAPKAYLGNYKIYGSPGVNDGTTDQAIMQALEDAIADGMDVINFSSGAPAFSGALESGASCGNPSGVACDLTAQAFESAARQVVVVSAGGNEGYDGLSSTVLGYGTIDSPASAPSVIAAGGVTNSHGFAEVVNAISPGAPASLQNIATNSGDAYVPVGSIPGALVDVTQLGNDGLACAALPAGSLVGAIALILRGTCNFSVKVNNAESAGAVGVILYMADSSALTPPGGLSSFPIPVVMVSNADGVALKSYANGASPHAVSITAAGYEQSATGGQVAFFSSLGPSTGDNLLKPDVLAVGTNIYMATASYDRAGALYSSDRFGVANGTSFSTPMTAGAAALVKQQHPGFSAAQIRSALANTAAQTVTTDDSGNPVDARAVGGGLLNAGLAIGTTVTASPTSVSFGVLNSQKLPLSQAVQITNSGSGSVSLSISVSAAVASSGATVQVDKSSLALSAGASGTVNVSLTGSAPAAGAYSGAVVVSGSGVSLRIPYLYLVGSGTVANLIPLTGTTFDGTIGQIIPDGLISFRLVDANGVAVAGAPVSFAAAGGTIQNADAVTDQYGIAAAVPVLGSTPGSATFTGSGGGFRTSFTGFSRPAPAISASGGVADAASLKLGQGVAPGSYIAIFGSGLCDYTDYAESAILPMAIDSAFVSFDVPSAGISEPGHLTYASPTQINLQVPWELASQTSAQVKVTIDYSTGNVVTIPLVTYSPNFFQSNGFAAALDENYAVVTTSNPVTRGHLVQLYGNGMGPVTNTPASGEPALANPLSETTTRPTLTIGGQPATVLFSGLTPGYPALYQINATVPTNVGAGTQPVVLTIGGVASTTVNLAVQ